MSAVTPEARLLTVRQVSELTGFGEPKIRLAINKGELHAKRIGISIRVRPVELDAWVDRQEDV